jgi:peptidyl-prolyl cis-trans isomerase B (cyclophilin B)
MRLKIPKFIVAFVIVGMLLISGCTGQPVASNTASPNSPIAETPTETTAAQATNEATSVSETTTSEGVSGMKDLARLEGKATVVMTVKGSPITIELDGTNAPITAGNFVDLVQQGVYDGLVFHRVIPEFVAQGGDPQSKDPGAAARLGTGSFIDPKTKQPRYIPLEIKPKGASAPTYSKPFDATAQPVELAHKVGAIAMARSGMPDSASSQFYFALVDLPSLDGSYAVFGNVKEGMDVVAKIQQGDKIDSAKVTQGAENLKKGA